MLSWSAIGKVWSAYRGRQSSPLLSPCEVQHWVPLYRRALELHRAQQRATKKTKGLQHLSDKDRQRAGCGQPGEDRWFYPYIQVLPVRLVMRWWPGPPAVPSNRLRGIRHNFNHRKFHMNTKKNFSAVQVTEHKQLQPGKAVEPLPSLVILKTYLDAKGWTKWSPEAPANPSCLSVCQWYFRHFCRIFWWSLFSAPAHYFLFFW